MPSTEKEVHSVIHFWLLVIDDVICFGEKTCFGVFILMEQYDVFAGGIVHGVALVMVLIGFLVMGVHVAF